MNRKELEARLEKRGLPIWGTDAELATRWELNNKPVAKHAPVPAAHVPTADGNSLLANRASLEAPKTPAEIAAVEVTSANVHEPHAKTVDYIPASEPRKPGRPPSAR